MTPKQMLFFPGSAMDGAGSEFGHSMLAVLDALGQPVRILDDWSCCGASAARSTDVELSVRLSARNLALAAGRYCDVLVSCAACYNNLAHTQNYLGENPEAWPTVEGQERPEAADVFHLLTVLTAEEMLERLRHKIVRPLADMRLACYYGCLLVRPGGYTYVDDSENPQTMDKLLRACGADTVDWSYKTDCCGGSSSLTQKKTAVGLMAKIFRSAMQQGADAMVTACPLCHMNLDAWQQEVGSVLGEDLSIPVYYVTELMALAMGLEGVETWLKGHLTDAQLAVKETR